MSGLNLALEREHQQETDYKFGAASPVCKYAIPEENRHLYLPEGEKQFTVKDDMMDCSTRALINIAESKFTYAYRSKLMLPENRKWLEDTGYIQGGVVTFSDAFIAIKSGTTRQGNSLKAPADAIYRYGLVPKALLPLEAWMTWEDYHNHKRITKSIEELGIQFKRRFKLNYDQVGEIFFPEALINDFVDVAGYAWPTPKNGVYPRADGKPFNHAFLLTKRQYTAFDNYLDTDGDYLKSLAANYAFYETGYRLYVSRELSTAEQEAEYKSELNKLYNALLWILSILPSLRAKIGGIWRS